MRASTRTQIEIFLNSPCRIIFCGREVNTAYQTPHERLATNRYIRVLRGSLVYTIDGTDTVARSGDLLLVPKNAMRRWSVAEDRICEILWAEFDSPEIMLDRHTLQMGHDRKGALEKQALLRIMSSWRFRQFLRGSTTPDPTIPPLVRLAMEGELKASLLRFWTRASGGRSRGNRTSSDEGKLHPEVSNALTWLADNFRRPEALKLFYSLLAVSPNHFRKLFQKGVGQSFSSHLYKLRMKEAMILLQSSSLSVKEISAAVGFNDALYFSRRFHRYWNIAPSELRK